MSIKVMTEVFDRYPDGGGEMLLALALADHARDDGTRVYPSIASLAQKTRQSVRSVQYQLRKMEGSGWLVLVNAGDGRMSLHREYQISIDWIKGADIAPPSNAFQKATENDAKNMGGGCNLQQVGDPEFAPVRVQPEVVGGATRGMGGCNGLHPSYNHEESSLNRHSNHPVGKDEYTDIFDQVWGSYPARPGSSKAAAFKAWNARLKKGSTTQQMAEGVSRYANYCEQSGTEPQYVKMPETFFGPNEHFLNSWICAAPKSKIPFSTPGMTRDHMGTIPDA